MVVPATDLLSGLLPRDGLLIQMASTSELRSIDKISTTIAEFVPKTFVFEDLGPHLLRYSQEACLTSMKTGWISQPPEKTGLGIEVDPPAIP